MPEFLPGQLVMVNFPGKGNKKLAIIQTHHGLIDNYEVLVINSNNQGSSLTLTAGESQISYATLKEIKKEVTTALAFTADKYFFFCKLSKGDTFYFAPISCNEDNPPKCKLPGRGDRLFIVEKFIEIKL